MLEILAWLFSLLLKVLACLFLELIMLVLSGAWVVLVVVTLVTLVSPIELFNRNLRAR